MKSSKRFLALVLAASVMPLAHADHLGAIGQSYPIKERSAVDMIMKKLRQKEKTGELKKLQEQAIERSLGNIKNMPPVEGIATVQERGYRMIDPTVTYAKAVTTDEGRVVVPAGAKINPFEMTSLTKTLVFFDGRDPAQREAVRKMVAKQGLRIKPVLVAGSWMDLTKAWQTQVYFDQRGTLTKRFGIRAVPSVIRQQGKMLRLEEVPAKELQ